ncbi:MAG: hypothetical protein IPG80_18505 [Anaerolineales bacterium]|uniref:hypothetical protein n=1 Tax=Candidatus Villigracilis vicinus TaxID=3140679 RepID=UPI00313491A3|nr:hypothetical protein [Anaerolineales bacterium]
MLDVEDVWFQRVAGIQPSDPLPETVETDRDTIRAHWDKVEKKSALILLLYKMTN